MFFWKKDKAREIFSALKEIMALINSLRKFEDKKGKTKEIIMSIKTKIRFVKNEIYKAVSEEKKKPWVDVKFDYEIDRLAEREIMHIDGTKTSDFSLQDKVPSLAQQNQRFCVQLSFAQFAS